MKTSELRRAFLELSKEEAAQYTTMYAGEAFAKGPRETAWDAIVENPDNLVYMDNILGGHSLRNRPAPTAAPPVLSDDEATVSAPEKPVETQPEVAAPALRPRKDDGIAAVLWPRN
jgi:hypothetical protein